MAIQEGIKLFKLAPEMRDSIVLTVLMSSFSLDGRDVTGLSVRAFPQVPVDRLLKTSM